MEAGHESDGWREVNRWLVQQNTCDRRGLVGYSRCASLRVELLVAMSKCLLLPAVPCIVPVSAMLMQVAGSLCSQVLVSAAVMARRL